MESQYWEMASTNPWPTQMCSTCISLRTVCSAIQWSMSHLLCPLSTSQYHDLSFPLHFQKCDKTQDDILYNFVSAEFGQIIRYLSAPITGSWQSQSVVVQLCICDGLKLCDKLSQGYNYTHCCATFRVFVVVISLQSHRYGLHWILVVGFVILAVPLYVHWPMAKAAGHMSCLQVQAGCFMARGSKLFWSCLHCVAVYISSCILTDHSSTYNMKIRKFCHGLSHLI
jgi:hypothetical protein